MLATVISVLLTTQLAAPLPVDSPLSPVVPASDPPSHSPYIKHHAIGWHVPKTAIPASGSGASAPYPSNSAAAGSDVSPVASMCSGAGDKRKKPKQKESAPDTPNNSTSKLMRNAFYPAVSGAQYYAQFGVHFHVGWQWIEDYTAEDILWDEYDMVVYFVAPTTSDGFTIPEGQTPLQNFVAAARARGKKALVSIGGWTGSVYFSELTTEGKREGFVNQLVQFANDNAIDGLDL